LAAWCWLLSVQHKLNDVNQVLNFPVAGEMISHPCFASVSQPQQLAAPNPCFPFLIQFDDSSAETCLYAFHAPLGGFAQLILDFYASWVLCLMN
jgi:hypothetical protein